MMAHGVPAANPATHGSGDRGSGVMAGQDGRCDSATVAGTVGMTNGIISPGATNTAGANVGTLTFANDLTLGGTETNIFDIVSPAASDKIVVTLSETGAITRIDNKAAGERYDVRADSFAVRTDLGTLDSSTAKCIKTRGGEGEAAFRVLERKFIENGHAARRAVVACGGGPPAPATEGAP